MISVKEKSKFFILREIYENNKIEKDRLCYKYNITYRQFDVALSDLYSVDKYIDIYNYEKLEININETGKEYLNRHKVDRAVILASGLGSRMGDITNDTSKCLLEVKNEILVERLIKQFKERGIDDITILIGYCKEQFYYLKDKFNITLVENKEYNTKNTIASFYHVIDKIENSNTYVSVGDIYLNENPFHLFEIEPYYIGPYLEDCSKEWVYKYDVNGKVHGVADGAICDYYLGGYSFHTKKFANEICKRVREKYNEENTERLYWEDILVRNFDTLPDFYMHKLPYGVLNEYDSIEDLEKNKSENENAKNISKKIFGINDDGKLKIEKISNGYTNFNYKVEYSNKEYVLRIPGVASALFTNRKVEKEIYKNLESHDITDKIVYFDDEGIKLSEFIQNAKTIDVNNEKDLENAMQMYNKLHSIGLNVNQDISIVNVLNSYLTILNKYNLRFIYDSVEDFDNIKTKCNKIIDFIDSFKRPQVLCHGDAACVNVLKSNGKYKLIDFEYAGMADPLTDIALFSVFSDFSITKVKETFRIYKENCDKNYIDCDENKLLSLIVAYMAIDSIACVICEIIRTSITQKNIKSFCETRIKMFNNNYDYLFV